MKDLKMLVAIPCYNCEKQIGRVLQEFDKKLLKQIDKIIVIDNVSTDNTAKAARQAAAKIGSKKIEVWQNKSNYGLGGTHKIAFLAAEKMGMDYVAILHGDNQAKAEELHELIQVASDHPELGAILGSRFMHGSHLSGYSKQRIWGNRLINILYSLVIMRKSKDLGSGLNLFRLIDLSDHRYLGFDDGITFNIDLLLDYFRKKTSLLFVPISWREEDQVSNARNFAIGLAAIKKLMRWRINQELFHPHAANYYKSEPFSLRHIRSTY